MKLKLPKVIETYVQASNESDLPNFISCFTDTATVFDEGEIRMGHSEIKKWFAKTRSKYQFKSEPLEITENKKHVIIKAKVSGTFPGSPITLSYRFEIKAGLIQDLRIV
jgi:ketosteroid isomerase-like protein